MAGKQFHELDELKLENVTDEQEIAVAGGAPLARRFALGTLKTWVKSFLGDAATRNVGTGADDVAAGDDERFAMQRLASVTVPQNVQVTSIEIPNIPQNFDSLRVVIRSKNTVTKTVGYLFLNGDLSTIYEGTGNASAVILPFISDNTTSGYAYFEIVLPNYTKNQFKEVITSCYNQNADATERNFGGGVYKSDLSITSLRFASEQNLVAGSTMTVYGVK